MTEQSQPLTCTFHPKRETALRCNRCEQPICVQCATQTPTGYRCPECIRNQKKKFVTVRWYDHLTSTVVSALLSFLGSLLAQWIGFYSLLIALFLGFGIARVVRFVIGNRRSPIIPWLSAGGALLGTLPLLVMALITFVLSSFAGGPVNIIGFLVQALFTVVVTTTVYYQFTG
jgi:hypothetical protein